MKRFVISIMVSVTMLAIGSSMLFFEFQQFEIVEVEDRESQKQTILIKLDEDEKFKIKANEWQHISFIEDKESGYNIEVEIPVGLDYEKDEDYLEIENSKTTKSSWNTIQNNFDLFLDGLKERKIYIDGYHSDEIIIRCSKEARDLIITKEKFD